MAESDTTANKTEHVPDPSRLPACVTGWETMDPKRLWYDGTQLLVAVPVNSKIPNAMARGPGWYYEFSVIVIRVDEDYFAIETSDGNSWGWELDCIDFYVILSE